MNKENQKQSTAAQKFWDAFKAYVEDNRVRPYHTGFYVNRAQCFVDFLPERRLRDLSRIVYEIFLPRYSPE